MGIYDREYYRNEGGGFLDAFASRGMAYRGLIVANVIVFFVQVITRQQGSVGGHHGAGWFTEAFEFQADSVLHGQVWRLLTYAFLHSSAGIWHLALNMFMLWWAGREVEDLYGPKEFLAFYFLAALIGGLAELAAVQTGIMPDVPMIGASGAVTAVLLLFALHYPTRTLLLFWVIPVPALLLVVLNILQDLSGLVTGASGGVAVACHLGGAAFGGLYYKFQWRVLNWLPGRIALPRLRPRPKLRVYRPDPQPEPVAAGVPRSETDAHLEEELDAVLEKVARHGRASLTERENQILMRASEVYKQRRK
jgi:membrane associated rhomboid family serine protease